MPNYWVVQTDKGWEVKPERGATASTHRTQQDAHDAARRILNSFPKGQGGELIVRDREGKIRIKDTINARDPESSIG